VTSALGIQIGEDRVVRVDGGNCRGVTAAIAAGDVGDQQTDAEEPVRNRTDQREREVPTVGAAGDCQHALRDDGFDEALHDLDHLGLGREPGRCGSPPMTRKVEVDALPAWMLLEDGLKVGHHVVAIG
jgi:hypothetical protein